MLFVYAWVLIELLDSFKPVGTC